MPAKLFTDEQTLVIRKALQQSFYQNDTELAQHLQETQESFSDFTIEQLKDKIVRVRGAMRTSGDTLRANTKRKVGGTTDPNFDYGTNEEDDLFETSGKKQKKANNTKGSTGN